MTTILSLQSWVSTGHVGNAAALFALQRLGFEVWPINTTAFSNHPGHGAYTGRLCPASEIAALLEGIDRRALLPGCDAVLSGYLGELPTGEVLLDIVGRIRQANPDALFCCDPVIGDEPAGLYVQPGIAEFFRDRALALADIATPNRFELEYLTGRPARTCGEVIAAAAALRRAGPKIVLVTGIDIGAAGEIAMLAAEENGAWAVSTPRLPLHASGSGDLVAALFLGWLMRQEPVPHALELAAGGVHAVVAATHAAKRDELALIPSQDALIAPPHRFSAVQVGAAGSN